MTTACDRLYAACCRFGIQSLQMRDTVLLLSVMIISTNIEAIHRLVQDTEENTSSYALNMAEGLMALTVISKLIGVVKKSATKQMFVADEMDAHSL